MEPSIQTERMNAMKHEIEDLREILSYIKGGVDQIMKKQDYTNGLHVSLDY